MAEQPTDEKSDDSSEVPPVVQQSILPAWLEPPKEKMEDPYWVSGNQDLLTPAQHSGSVRLLVAVLAIVGVGLTMIAPGLGILMAVLVLPPLVRTVLVARSRAAHQLPTSAVDQVALFVGSFGVTLTVGTVVLVSAFGTFCFVCLSTGTEKALPAAMIAAGVAGLAASIPMFFWIRHRWLSHTKKP